MSEPSMTCRELSQQRQNRAEWLPRDQVQRVPAYWLSGVRHKGGVTSDRAQMRNVRTCRFNDKRRAQADSLRKGASIDMKHRDGVARSSDEAGENSRSEGATLFSRARWPTVRGRSQ